MIKVIHKEDIFHGYTYNSISLYEKNLLFGLIRQEQSFSDVITDKKLTNYLSVKIFCT